MFSNLKKGGKNVENLVQVEFKFGGQAPETPGALCMEAINLLLEITPESSAAVSPQPCPPSSSVWSACQQCDLEPCAPSRWGEHGARRRAGAVPSRGRGRPSA